MTYREDASRKKAPYKEYLSEEKDPFAKYLRKGNDPYEKFEQYVETKEAKLARGLTEEEKYKYAKEENPFIYSLAELSTAIPPLEKQINEWGEAVRPINEKADELSKKLYIQDALKGIVNTGANIAGPVSENMSKLTGQDSQVESFGPEYGSGNPYGEEVSGISQALSTAYGGRLLFGDLNNLRPSPRGYEGILSDFLKGYVGGDTGGGPFGGIIGGVLGGTRRFGAGNQARRIAADSEQVRGEYNHAYQELGDGARMAGANNIPPTGITRQQINRLQRAQTERKLDPINDYLHGDRSYDSAFSAQSELGKIIRDLTRKRDAHGLSGYERNGLRAAQEMQNAIRSSIRNQLQNSRIPELSERFDEVTAGYERDVVGYDNPALTKYMDRAAKAERSTEGSARTAEKELVNALKKDSDFQSRFGRRYPELQHGWLGPTGLTGSGLGAAGTALHKQILGLF